MCKKHLKRGLLTTPKRDRAASKLFNEKVHFSHSNSQDLGFSLLLRRLLGHSRVERLVLDAYLLLGLCPLCAARTCHQLYTGEPAAHAA